MNDIVKLLEKYYKCDGDNLTGIEKPTRAEKTTKDYNRKMKKKQYNRNRHLILDVLLNEVPYKFKTYQIVQVRYWIDRFNDNFKDFHRQASNEAIILAFLLIHWKQENPKLKISNLPITHKYNLTIEKFILIETRLLFKLMQSTELVYNQRRYVNSNLLEEPQYD